MSRLKDLLHVSRAITCNTQQSSVQARKAVAQHMHTAQQALLPVSRPSPCNTQQAAVDVNTAANEMFCFSPPGVSANEDESLQERVAIMMEANRWDEATAIKEARWQADKDRCWQGFRRNAQRVLAAPESEREVLLARYQAEATRRYGQAAGENMAGSLRAWVIARRVH